MENVDDIEIASRAAGFLDTVNDKLELDMISPRTWPSTERSFHADIEAGDGKDIDWDSQLLPLPVR
jgi:hypothetical protein